MRTLTLRILFGLALTMVMVHTAAAQDTTSSYEVEIKKLRTNIQLEINNRPPAGASAQDEDLHRTNLLSFRRQLQRLLWKKTGALEVRIQNLQSPDALPEVLAHADHLQQELQAVNTELQELDRTAGENPGSVIAATAPVQPTPPSRVERPATVPAVKSEGLARFDAEVANLSPTELEAAAIPEVVPRGVAPTCNANGRPAALAFSRLDEAICRLASDISGTEPAERREIDLENDQYPLMTILIAKLLKGKTSDGESYAAFVTEAQEKRLDQLMGAGPTSNSATSLVSKGGIPYLLGFAVENGAAEESRDDTQVTFRINPGGVINLFSGKGFITGFQESDNDAFLKFLRKTSLGLTFDTTRGDTPGVFTGGQQLSQVSARIEVFNDRDPRHKRYAREWEKFVSSEGVKLADQTWKTTVLLTNWGGANDDITFVDPALQAWLNETNRKVAELDPGLNGVERFNAVAKVVSEQADRVPVKLVTEKVIETLTDFARENKAYTDAKNRLFDRIARGRIFTIDYTNQREVNAPDTSNLTFIASTGTAGRVSLTANGSFTFFHTRPVATLFSARPGRFRDFQFAGEVNVPFKVGDGQFDFWFSGKYERLLEDASSFGGFAIPNTKGDIAVGQFGLNIPIKALGIKFPVSFTFANRTELVKEKEIRGNFGFTFNWDTILSKLKPF